MNPIIPDHSLVTGNHIYWYSDDYSTGTTFRNLHL